MNGGWPEAQQKRVCQSSLMRPEELAEVLGAMREGLQVIDRSWRYVYVNPAAAAHGRKSVNDLLGRSMMECYPGIEHTEMFATLTRCMQERVSATLRNEFVYPDGKAGTFELRVQPSRAGITVLSIDVSQEQELEAQLRHAQKMEAVGRLVSGITHDFNNVLSVILSYSALLLKDLSPEDPARDDIAVIHRAGERAATLTQRLLAFSRRQVMARRRVNLNELIEQSRRIYTRLLGKEVELTIHLDESLPLVKVDPGQIDQIVMNLLANARDAMPLGGKVMVETQRVILDEGSVAAHVDLKPGRFAMLAVSDAGIGMDKATQARIFEPFFTTKGPTQGTGLGLSTVFGIVKQSGGSIYVYSEPNRGTTFKLYFPQLETEEGDEPSPASRPLTLQGTETILVADDEEDVRVVIAKILKRHGYQVLEATDAREVLSICENHPGDIHLLLTDLIMPGATTSSEIAQRLMEVRPRVKILYMSGYTDAAIAQHESLELGATHLQKPISPNVLAERVRTLLDAPTRTT